jgi:hypothetical protein
MIRRHEALEEIKQEITKSLKTGYELREIEIHLVSNIGIFDSHTKYDKISVWPLMDAGKAKDISDQIKEVYSGINVQNRQGRFFCIILKEKLD